MRTPDFKDRLAAANAAKKASRDQVAVRLSNMTPCLIGNRKGTA
jgi:hypothetical protein